MRHPAQANQQIGDLLDLLELDQTFPEREMSRTALSPRFTCP